MCSPDKDIELSNHIGIFRFKETIDTDNVYLERVVSLN